MKYYVLTTALYLCLISTTLANVINGFKYDLMKLEKKIRNTTVMMEETSDQKARKKLDKQIKRLNKELVSIQYNYDKTQALINEVREIDPELFSRVWGVTNVEGTLTHVYVKYVSRTSEEYTRIAGNHYVAAAYTSVGRAQDNAHVCTSNAGTNTISITVSSGCDALKALGHEFAHVLYIVPNLEAYIQFWLSNDDFHNGHSKSDPSYFSLNETESNYLNRYVAHMSQKKRNKQAGAAHTLASEHGQQTEQP